MKSWLIELFEKKGYGSLFLPRLEGAKGVAKPGNLGLAGTCSLRDGTPSQWRKEGGGIEKVFLRGPEAAGAHQRVLAALLRDGNEEELHDVDARRPHVDRRVRSRGGDERRAHSGSRQSGRYEGERDGWLEVSAERG